MTCLTTPKRFIGCDVGKTTIVVFDSADGRIASLSNTPAALAAFAASLDATCLVVCEATGGHEAILLDALLAASRAVHRADARKVKAFIRSLGTLGKTDAIDARALARYAMERHDRLPRFQPRDEHRRRLHAMVSTRRDLVEARVACNNRLAAPGVEPVAIRLQNLLATLNREIAGLDADIKSLIAEDAPLARSAKILLAIAGIGQTTAATLLALMPELGTLHRRQAAALAGLAPHPRQSGSADRYRRTRGGRPDVKRLLFMAALSARRHNPALKSFFQRLIANGKKPLVAITAIMRKLVVIANARLRQATVLN